MSAKIMKIGASTKSFGGKSTREVAELFAKCGLNTAELCFCQSDLSGFRYNLCGNADLTDVKTVKDAGEIFKNYGIDICALGVYLNFWSGGNSEIYETLGLFTRYCDIALTIGVKALTTHTGSVFSVPALRGFDEKLCERLYSGFTYAAVEAYKRGLTVGVEIGENDAVKSYGEFIKLKEYVQSVTGAGDALRCICSPMPDTDIPIGETVLYHIKDRKSGGKFYERFGEGDTDFSEFFENFYKRRDIPIILEYVNSENLADTVRRFTYALESSKNALNFEKHT